MRFLQAKNSSVQSCFFIDNQHIISSYRRHMEREFYQYQIATSYSINFIFARFPNLLIWLFWDSVCDWIISVKLKDPWLPPHARLWIQVISSQVPKLEIQPSYCIDNANNLENWCERIEFPAHLSVQNLTIFPFATTNLNEFLKLLHDSFFDPSTE